MDTTISDLRCILLRDLDTLADQLRGYPDERLIWEAPEGITNTGGTLALHLAGNISHYLGAVLGGSDYVRDRPAEFGDRDVPRAELLARIDQARAAVDETLRSLDPGRMVEPFPVEVGGVRLPTGRLLLHLTAHFAYHLGQLDYHRRLVTGDASGVGAQSVRALSD